MVLSDYTASLFILYLIISSNFLAPLFSCKVQTFIQSSMLVRNVLGFLTMTFFVVLANQKDPLPIVKLFGLSAGLYTWFFLSTRMSVVPWILLLILIGTCYILKIYEDNMKNDEATLKENEHILKIIQTTKNILTILALGVTGIGVVLYFGEKRIEYGSNFDFSKFLIGTPECRKYTPPISVGEKLKGVFGKK